MRAAEGEEVKIMRNPLIKRLPRDLKGEFSKYAVIFILMVLTISFVSGFLVAGNSMIKAYNDSFEKYNIENGNLRLSDKADENMIAEIEKNDITLYENFFREKSCKNDSRIRLFKDRKDVNKVCLMSGEMPAAADEIGIDRMFADNNKIKVGDEISVGGKSFKVSGLVALPDYSCLFENNGDTMFDALKFGVGILTEEGFDSFEDEKIIYSYSWKYKQEPADEKEEKKTSEELMKSIASIAPLEDFVPRFLNQAINFTGDDLGSDKSMMITLLFVVIVILAFVFTITINGTILKESTVIGTLRASGYSKGELIRHYMAMPVIITLISAAIGNVLGYTVLKDVCASLYYNSYSLTTYKTLWNAEAFLLTTVVPAVLMVAITFAMLASKLSLTPLRFLRRDLKRKQRKKAFKLNTKIRIMNRFRMRIIFQNIGNYITVFIGIIFANFLLFFGLLLPSVLDNQQKLTLDTMLSDYQYILKVPAETKTEGAEKFAIYSLNTIEGKYKSEEISIYGIEKNSSYIDADLSDGVYVSSGFAEKYKLEEGSVVTLKEKYLDDEYEFKVAGIYDYPASLTVFADIDFFRDTFGKEPDYFNGYFSSEEIADIDDVLVSGVIDEEAMTKLTRQLDKSMGEMMSLVEGFALIMFFVLIFLLSKVIIEKNAQSISMTKILGYTNAEISGLYVASTSIVVVLSILLSLPVISWSMKIIFNEYIMRSMKGWIIYYVDTKLLAEMVVLGIVTYAVIAAVEFRRIRKIPMDEALKNVE